MRSVAGIAVAMWLGVMGFFALGVAPAAFGALDRDAAGRLVSAVFPRYYLVGVVLGACALAALAARAMSSGVRGGDWFSLGAVAGMLALTLYAWLVVLPAAHTAREAIKQGGAAAQVEEVTFARLHRLSTMLNGIVIVTGLTFVAFEAVRRP